MPLTKRQREILNYLTLYSEQNGYAPSFEEIAEQFNYNSLATVHEHLSNLERKGYIKRSYNESRAIEILPSEACPRAIELPLLGAVAAGVPIEAIAHQESIAVPDSFVQRGGNHYVLRVRGNSMIEEQIRDGDFVVVNERQRADNGEMVIAHAARQLGDGEEVLPRARRPHPPAAGERDDGADVRPRERHHDPGDRRRRDAAVLSARDRTRDRNGARCGAPFCIVLGTRRQPSGAEYAPRSRSSARSPAPSSSAAAHAPAPRRSRGARPLT